ncbi:MAG: type II toxin-antitoxin system prevent-host-death family antitoxin [Clostridiales Family XIII bacterium]|jgi:prevent-host-death family protein|nr:type II toxin-antitoxin system prevent-host-death family antitoxin [Clostridiales Family XIII bacterium]
MTTIKPVSDLRNYTNVLKDVSKDEPVYLTKNGRGKYVIADIEDYDRAKATLKLFGALQRGELSAQKEGWIEEKDFWQSLGIAND